MPREGPLVTTAQSGRELLHNLTAFDGRDYQLVPEAVRPDGGIDLCGRCRRAFHAQEPAKRRAMPRCVSEAGAGAGGENRGGVILRSGRALERNLRSGPAA